MNEPTKKQPKHPALDALTDDQKAAMVEGAKVAHAQPPSEFRAEFEARAERRFAREQAKTN